MLLIVLKKDFVYEVATMNEQIVNCNVACTSHASVAQCGDILRYDFWVQHSQ